MTVEIAQDARATIGEGPVWDERGGRLHWVDVPAGLVHRFSPADGSDLIIDVGQPVGSIGLGSQGGLVLAIRDGFALISARSESMGRSIEVEKDVVANKMNDGRTDRAGRFWAGTMAVDHEPRAGALYRLEQISGLLSVTRALSGLTIANGIDWSLDGRLMYYIDSPTQRVDVFDFDEETGAITHRRPFVLIPEADGLPDGMVVDADGYVWVALFGAGRLRRYSPAGEIDRDINLPVSLVTSAAFGGSDLGDLFITTARHRLTAIEAERQQHAGSLFVCRPGAIGRPAERFRWI